MDLRYIARPYAKAVFALGLEHNTLQIWSEWLANSSVLANQEEMKKLLANPLVPKEELLSLFTELLTREQEPLGLNLLDVLIDNRRLNTLPFIAEQFAKLYAEYKKQVNVEVVSSEPLTADQQQALIRALEKRLHREVNLTKNDVDKNILGGAIIYADDLVIDGSGRGRLDQLSEYLKGKKSCN